MHDVKTRNPVGIFFLAFFTFGIYYLYWFYKVNEEAAIISGDEDANPGLSLLAASVGWLLIIPPFWTIGRLPSESESLRGSRPRPGPTFCVRSSSCRSRASSTPTGTRASSTSWFGGSTLNVAGGKARKHPSPHPKHRLAG
jgi:hypothetical protein